MARIIEETPTTEKVIVQERDHDHVHDTPARSNTPIIIAAVIIILLLLLLFGRGLFGGGSGGNGGGSTNVTPSTTGTNQ